MQISRPHLALILLLPLANHAESTSRSRDGVAPPRHGANSRSLQAEFERLRSSPPELYAFLLRMPKGADLHNHLAGAVYAETYLKDAASDHLCIAQHPMSIVPALPGKPGVCPEGSLAAASVLSNDDVTSALIDSLSMRDFVPASETPHDHFFGTFAKVDAAQPGHDAASIAQVVQRAADQNESCLELMAYTAGRAVMSMGKQLASVSDFETARKTLLAGGLGSAVNKLGERVRAVHQDSRRIMECSASPQSAPCRMQVRYILQVLRNMPPEQVFTQILACFMLANSEPLVASINLVQPEDAFYSMRDYELHMRMLRYVRELFPNVRLTLHAGELASGIVPPDGLRFHISDALQVAQAERIGHGVDIMYERNAYSTLRYMRDHAIAVELNLTSNDIILGVKNENHPLPVYLKFGVPVTLATDDEGVSRTHLTEEYKRAVLSYHLSYDQVKQIARNGIHFSFLPGESYWLDQTYKRVKTPCQQIDSASCRNLAERSEKARAEIDLEARFQKFEAEELNELQAEH